MVHAGTSAVSLGARQAAVLAHLGEHPGLTAGEFARAFGLRNSVIDLLRRLEQRAQVVAVTSWAPHQGRNVSRWYIAPPGTVPPPQLPPDPDAAARRRERDRLATRARRARARGFVVQAGIEPPSLRNRPAAAAPLPGAAGRAADPDLFFGPDGERDDDREIREAKAICAHCPARAACYARAVASREEHGVWGGESFETETKTKGRRAS